MKTLTKKTANWFKISAALASLFLVAACGNSGGGSNNPAVNTLGVNGYGIGNCPTCTVNGAGAVQAVGQNGAGTVQLQLYVGNSSVMAPQGVLVVTQGNIACGYPPGQYQLTTSQPGQWIGSLSFSGLVMQGVGGQAPIQVYFPNNFFTPSNGGQMRVQNAVYIAGPGITGYCSAEPIVLY